MFSNSPKRNRYAGHHTWQHMSELYAWIVSLFGAPAAIASQMMLMRRDRVAILEWLGPVEALARRLLLLKALTMPTLNETSAPAAPGRLLTAFADRPLEALDPEAANWRVRFCVMPHGVLRRRPRAECGGGAHPGGGGVNLNAPPLARRIEALRRVLENPGPALARLRGLLAGRRAAVVTAFRPYRPRATPVASLLPAAQTALELALNSS
jgi:hypothetical protein